jgi:hypothetical protein
VVDVVVGAQKCVKVLADINVVDNDSANTKVVEGDFVACSMVKKG